MKLRFNIKQLAYNYIEDNLCDGTLSNNYTNLRASIYVDDQLVASSNNLALGFLFGALPITTTLNGIVISAIAIENSIYCAFTIDLPLIQDKAKVRVVFEKTGFNTLDRTFFVYGYDLGINPNVAITLTNPKVEFILSPTLRGATFATGTRVTGIGQSFTVTADNLGTIGNAFVINFNGVDDTQTLINNWNVANPTNTVSAVDTGGGLAFVIGAGSFTIAGGTDEVIDDKTYASFHGWRIPYRNDLFLYHNNSALYTRIEYSNADEIVARFLDAILCCKGEDFKQTAVIYGHSDCGCGSTQLLDTCETDFQNYPSKRFIPNLDFHVSCDANCCTDDCVILGQDNVIKPLVDFNVVDLANIDDVLDVPFEEMEMIAEIFNCEGTLIDTQAVTIPIAIPVDVTAIELSFTPPAQGDYLVKVTYLVEGAFQCTYTKVVKVCNPYTIKKLDCGKYQACIYKIAETPTSEVLYIQKLNDDKIFVPFVDYEIDYCTCKEIVLTEDGIYNFQFQNGEENSNMIVIVDCNWKACMLEYIKKFACTKVAACSCGGNCTNNCTSVPHDMYDFNAFSVLSWAYGSLINTEYLNNYIYAVLEPNKLDELFVLSTFLNRAKEYCAKCATATTGSSSSSGCGCKKV